MKKIKFKLCFFRHTNMNFKTYVKSIPSIIRAFYFFDISRAVVHSNNVQFSSAEICQPIKIFQISDTMNRFNFAGAFAKISISSNLYYFPSQMLDRVWDHPPTN